MPVPLPTSCRETMTATEAERTLMQVADFLRGVCRNLLAGLPEVQRWDETDDIFQACALRLFRSIQGINPDSHRHLENLAAVQVHRTLINLGRKFASSATTNAAKLTPLNPA